MIAPSKSLNVILSTIYALECPQTEASTLGKMRGHIARWDLLTSCCPVDQIGRHTLLEFRRACLELGLSPSTINSYLRTVTGLAKVAGHPLPDDQLQRIHLTERDDPLPTPRLDTLDHIWRVTNLATWPNIRRVNARPVWCRIPPMLWWRAVLMLAYTTGLRRADLFGLTWDQVEPDRIPTRNRKTKKTQYIPIADQLRPWLDLLKRNNTETVLGPGDRCQQIDRELNRFAAAVGLPDLGLQAMRRAAARAYEKAHPGCGKIILNHGKSVTERNYLDTEETLRDAQPKLIYPPSFLERPSLERQGLLF